MSPGPIVIRPISFRYLAFLVMVAIVYFAAAELGLSLASVHTNVSPVWPPTGIAIASLLVFGRRISMGVFLGAFAANLWTGVSTATAAGIATGNTLEALTAIYLLQRDKNFSKSLDRIADVIKFTLLTVFFSPMVSATIGNLSLALGGAARWTDFPELWLTWWLGDGFGALVVAPFLLAWSVPLPKKVKWQRVAEGTVLLTLLFVTAMMAVGGWFPGGVKDYPLAHLAFPFLIWAALRFDQRMLTTAIVLLAGTAIWGTAHGFGPFIRRTPNESLLMLQIFLGLSSLMALVLFAVISERKKAEEDKLRLGTQVEVQRQRVEDIVAHVPGVVWEAWGEPDAATQRINFVSNYVEKMLGYSEQEWLSTRNFWLAIVHPDDRERAAREAGDIFASGSGGVSRFRWVAKNGREIWVEAQSVVVCDEKGQPMGMRGVTMDITTAVVAESERAALLEREQRARAQAEEAGRLKDEFLATVSHELRTPLNAVVGWSRILRSGQLDNDSSAHALDVIERNAWSQKRIVEDMLDVSRIITGKLQLGLIPLELSPVIHAAIDVIRPAAEAKEIKIVTKISAPELTVSGDSDRLQQVAWNLLSNAVKFTPRNGQIEVSVRQRGAHAEITVTDTGPGIAPEFLSHVFERFRQADGSTTRTHGGLGLGLAIVRHLVELHGGTVEAANCKQDHGATFTVRLPVMARKRVKAS
jgi:PAS domain S-box-containing protein